MRVQNENEVEIEIKNENENEIVKKEGIKLKFFKSLKKYLTKKIIIGIIILLSISGIGLGLGKFISFDSKTTRIGFEDIGEFATQTAYCTSLSVTDKSRDLFGIRIPFTQSKYIYSYDIFIKAGFDFKDIEWEENGTSIEVKLPEPKVLSSEIDLDSFKIYHEDESIFTKIDMITFTFLFEECFMNFTPILKRTIFFSFFIGMMFIYFFKWDYINIGSLNDTYGFFF